MVIIFHTNITNRNEKTQRSTVYMRRINNQERQDNLEKQKRSTEVKPSLSDIAVRWQTSEQKLNIFFP